MHTKTDGSGPASTRLLALKDARVASSLFWIVGVAALIACGATSSKPADAPPQQASPLITAEADEASPTTAPAAATQGHDEEARPKVETGHEGAAPLSHEPPHAASHEHGAQSMGQASMPGGLPRATNNTSGGGVGELAAYESAKPVFETHCGRCHTSQGGKTSKNAIKHFSMDEYPFGGHHSAEMSAEIREVLGASGSKPSMPKDKPGALGKQELQLVLAWADAYDRAHSATAPSH